MSSKEMEKLDADVLEVANRAGQERAKQESEAAQDAEAARAERLEKDRVAEKTKCTAEQDAAMVKANRKAWRRYQAKRILGLVGRLTCSAVLAAAFVMMLFVYWWVDVMVYTGAAVCIAAAAITVDRFIRRRS